MKESRGPYPLERLQDEHFNMTESSYRRSPPSLSLYKKFNIPVLSCSPYPPFRIPPLSLYPLRMFTVLEVERKGRRRRRGCLNLENLPENGNKPSLDDPIPVLGKLPINLHYSMPRNRDSDVEPRRKIG